jgi:DUF1680 family protein
MKKLTVVCICVIVCLSCKEQNRLPEEQLREFSLHDVRLTNSPFKHAMERDEVWLLSFDPDRFLSGFRSESGLTPKAPKYGGWESQGVAGQTFGHYLSALSMMYASTGNEKLNERIKYSINELDTCQQAFDLQGLVAGFPRAKGLFQEIMAGEVRTEGFDLNGGWVPLYTMHKLFAGLIDVHKYTGNRQAYSVLMNLSEGLNQLFSGLSDEQIQKILICEHGGINESVAEIYALTGDEKYIRLADRLNHKVVLDSLIQGVDDLAGKHANTQIPKVIGLIRQYELTGDRQKFKGADFFWNTVLHHHSYVIGGNSEAEHFGVPDRTYDRITDKTCENCNTYNMLKLTRHLHELNPSVEKVDFYERALYNQILSSQRPSDGMVCYMSPLAAGSRRWFSTPFDSFWCCVGTGIENHARYGEFIYLSDKNKNLYVNLFIPSVLTWKERNIAFSQVTDFPASNVVSYVINTEKEQRFALNIRVPKWTGKTHLLINGKEVSTQLKNNYLYIEREWKNGDEITYTLSPKLSSEAALGDSLLRAYLYGPIVLSAILDRKESDNINPVVVTDDFNDANSVLENTKEPLLFTFTKSQPDIVKMKPYYQTSDETLMVYFEHYTKKDWEENSNLILMKQNRERWLKERTVSHFRPGEMQPERDHNFKGENIELGEMEGRKYRKAPAGWFSFDMAVFPDKPMDLSATFWGNLGDIYKFQIEVEGTSIATVIIHWWGNQFVEKTYHIPTELTQGKRSVNVKFRALNKKSVAGPLFDCKVLNR